MYNTSSQEYSKNFFEDLPVDSAYSQEASSCVDVRASTKYSFGNPLFEDLGDASPNSQQIRFTFEDNSVDKLDWTPQISGLGVEKKPSFTDCEISSCQGEFEVTF